MKRSFLVPQRIGPEGLNRGVQRVIGIGMALLSVWLGAQTALAQVPVVTSDPASEITGSGAVVNGTVNPAGQPAACYAEWGLTVSYGTTGPIVLVPAASTAVAVSNNLVNLSANTTYHYRLVATNSSGAGYSSDRTLTTTAGPSGLPPAALTEPATDITTTGATLWATVGSGGLFSGYYFRWGLDTSYGNNLPPSFIAMNDYQIRVYQPLSGLNPGVTYHFQVVATNAAGTTFGPDQVFTTQGFFTNNNHVFTYLVTNGVIAITAYSGPGGEVTIPGAIVGLPVTTIGDAAFANVPSLTRVIIPDSVTALGAYAFASNLGLTNVTIPNSISSISDYAFNNSGLTRVVIPDSVTSIGVASFAWCPNLADLTIGSRVELLGSAAFSVCPSLTRVVVPDSVTWIDDGLLDFGGPVGVFGRCSGLTNVVLGSGLQGLGSGAFIFCPNLTGIYCRGNAPDLGTGPFSQGIFNFSDAVIVYYLTGATGWGPTYAGRPTMLWNASLTAGNGSGGPGIRDGRFGFDIAGTPNIPLLIEASANPATGPWVPLDTCTLTNGLLHFSDPAAMNAYPARFYRVRWP